ncbi:Transcriptional regulatory protein ZraR [Posidoniimonas corsicana]|uniref:Transcriptional regulatory protein ZraR n=1 Tax=Posidoniimonas corsicana TaxID=1938618 RepID=A0A5C5UXI7_9BACT|nr:response regulator [Posidoniimonas corsicana]TWT30182.1 Transcriptional regulatory protein ZraR [Posidoniimonas corsicana]
MPTPNFHHVRIVVAEDDPASQTVLVRLLDKLGYRVACIVANGAELLERCRAERFDVVLADLDMPRMDGLEAAEEIAKLGQPCILISGHADLHQMVLEREPVISALSKPVDMDQLREALEAALPSLG